MLLIHYMLTVDHLYYMKICMNETKDRKDDL